MCKIPLCISLLAAPIWAQEPLSLPDAVRLALAHNQAIAAASAGASAAEARVGEARSGWLPRLNYSESFTRSDNPVFVFSSLLTQHQFTAGNFQLGPLNRPDALNNFQSQLAVDQVIYDGGRSRQAVRSAELAHELSGEEERRAHMQVLAGVARAYYGDLLAEANLTAGEEALRSADADLQRAETVRAADLDVARTNWLAAASLEWNLFNGFGDRARIQAATQGLRRAEAEQERAGSGIRLEVRRACADLHAAGRRNSCQ